MLQELDVFMQLLFSFVPIILSIIVSVLINRDQNPEKDNYLQCAAICSGFNFISLVVEYICISIVAGSNGIYEVSQKYNSEYVTVSENAAYSGKKPSGKISVAGSSSVSPVMEKLAEAYQKVNTNAKVEIQTSDSSAGMQSAMGGTCDIGMASRDLKDEEKSALKVETIAKDGIAVIVNNANTCDDLTLDQVKSIYTGETTVWSDIIK